MPALAEMTKTKSAIVMDVKIGVTIVILHVEGYILLVKGGWYFCTEKNTIHLLLTIFWQSWQSLRKYASPFIIKILVLHSFT